MHVTTKKTYSEGGGADVGGKALFEGSTGSELITGCDLPEPHRWVGAYPPVNPVIFVLTRVLVFVIHLAIQKVTIMINIFCVG